MKITILLISLILITFFAPIGWMVYQSANYIHAADRPVTAGVYAYGPDNTTGHMTFVVLSDKTGGYVGGGYFDSIMTVVNTYNPNFVIGMGDLIQGNADSATEHAQWTTVLTEIDTGLTVPYYFVIGNHDSAYWAASVAAGEAFYLARTGAPTRYTFESHNNLFLIFRYLSNDTLDYNTEDLAFVTDQVETWATTYDNIFVFTHSPAWWNHTIVSGTNVINDTLHELFKNEGGVTAVFTGHYHLYYNQTYDDIQYCMTGRSGGVDLTTIDADDSLWFPKDSRFTNPASSEYHGFVLVTVTDVVTIEYISVFTADP